MYLNYSLISAIKIFLFFFLINNKHFVYKLLVSHLDRNVILLSILIDFAKSIYRITIIFICPLPEGGGGYTVFIPPLPKGGGGILFYLCPSFRPSKIFFVTFFSVTVDGRNLIFGHKRHIGIPYCGWRFWTRQIPTSCLPT
jgi:hypothetical protein